MTNKRQHERIDVAFRVVVLHEGREIVTQSRNLSGGGMLIEGATELAYGAVVRIQATLPVPPNGQELDVESTVRWNRDGAVGLQFGSLRAKETWAIHQLVKMLAEPA